MTPSAPEIILHHYSFSTFSERVRLAFGLKGLAWRSVDIPPAMPKPDLLPLTGGYRRTPVMQIGADVYCDTALILRRIEALHPEPSLYPDGTEALAEAVTWWADKTLFWAALGVVATTIRMPEDFVAERRAFGFPVDPAEVGPVLYRHLQQGAAHFDRLGRMLADGRPFLLGDRPGAADLSAYCPVWLVGDRGGPAAEAKLPLAPLAAWRARVAAIGHGTPVDLSAAEALEIAAAATPAAPVPGDADPSGLRAGTVVTVTPDDTGRDPVRGVLLGADAEQVSIRIEEPRLGTLHVHFPRAGFDVVAADA